MVTALASHSGRLIVFTERTMIDIGDLCRLGSWPAASAAGAGRPGPAVRHACLAEPRRLLRLERRQRHRQVQRSIHRMVKTELAKGSLRNAVSVLDPESRGTGAVTPAGSFENTLLLCFDGKGWRAQKLGYDITDMCATDDPRYLVLFAALTKSGWSKRPGG